MPAGTITEFEKEILKATYIVAICTTNYQQRYTNYSTTDSGVGREMERIKGRLKDFDLKGTVFPIYRGGPFDACVPDVLRAFNALDVTDHKKYFTAIFNLSQALLLFKTVDADPIKSIRDSFLVQYTTIKLKIEKKYDEQQPNHVQIQAVKQTRRIFISYCWKNSKQAEQSKQIAMLWKN